MNVCACAVKICHDGMLEDTNSLDAAQLDITTLHKDITGTMGNIVNPLRVEIGPRQANLCLRAFRHDKFHLRMPSHSEGTGIWLSD